MSSSEEFFVGYAPQAPEGLARSIKARVLALLVLIGALAAGLTSGHGLRPAARFDYDSPVELAGTLVARPYPHLLVARPGRVGAQSPVSTYTLVGPWKRGADSLVGEFDGASVRLEANLAFRDGHVVAELVPGSLRADPNAKSGRLRKIPLGRRTLTGEIVDSKCFFGVMNPGELKPHRACAARCISGGIPPVLCVRDASGRASYLLLVSSTGEAVNADVLDLVAEPVRITGEVERWGDNLVLFADPSSYGRLE